MKALLPLTVLGACLALVGCGSGSRTPTTPPVLQLPRVVCPRPPAPAPPPVPNPADAIVPPQLTRAAHVDPDMKKDCDNPHLVHAE